MTRFSESQKLDFCVGFISFGACLWVIFLFILLSPPWPLELELGVVIVCLGLAVESFAAGFNFDTVMKWVYIPTIVIGYGLFAYGILLFFIRMFFE
jgi:hypothetical protein